MDNGLYGAQNAKAQNIKFIITTALVALVILGIAVWSIVFIVGQQENTNLETSSTEESTTASVTDQISQEIVEVTESTTEPKAVEQTPETVAAASVSTTSTTTTNDSSIPKTGPEDVLPLALLVGTAIAYFGSKTLAKKDV